MFRGLLQRQAEEPEQAASLLGLRSPGWCRPRRRERQGSKGGRLQAALPGLAGLAITPFLLVASLGASRGGLGPLL